MENEFDYYLIEHDRGSYPSIETDDDALSCNTAFLRRMEPAAANTVAYLKFRYVEKGFTMPDYLWCECRAVFSKKICDVLKDMDIKNIQLVPTVVKGKKGETYTDYWINHVYREFSFLDPNKSEVERICTEGRSAGCWDGIEKMVINESEMAKIPLAERLVYVSREWSAKVFYHKFVVDAIMSVNPVGLRAISVAEWCD